MQRTEIRVSVSSEAELRSLFDRELRHHRTFVNGRFDLADREACSLVLVHPTGRTFTIPAEAVYLKRDDPGAGAGLDLVGMDTKLLAELERFVNESVTAPVTPNAVRADEAVALDEAGTRDKPHAAMAVLDDEGSDPTGSAPSSETEEASQARLARNVHERVRHLSLREREALCRSGTLVERVALERAFGGSVWEALLQNPQLTAPEVARMAKNGTVPVPLITIIVANASWLASGEVRRALLGNTRVAGQNLDRVMRAFPRNELRQVAQTAYRREVREAAQRIVGK